MHPVTCVYCKKKFDRDKEPFVQVSTKRYAHQACAMSEEEKINQEEKDKYALEEYIKELFKLDYVDARIRKQMNQYVKEYNYTYSGMQKALIYFFEIKGNSIEKANGGIGIIPYVYKQAFDYYYALWLAQQKNTETIIADYVPKVVEIVIPEPKKKIKKRKKFAFLDEEGNENGQ